MKVILHPEYEINNSLGFVAVDNHGTYLKTGFSSEEDAYSFLISLISEELFILKKDGGEESIRKSEKLNIQKKLFEDTLSQIRKDHSPN